MEEEVKEQKTYEELMLERIEKSPLKKFQEKYKSAEEDMEFILKEGIYCNKVF